jgi:hypothetical protein
VLELADAAGTANTRPISAHAAIASPWSTGQLSQVVWSDIFGHPDSIVTRAEAMRVPAVVKGRGLVAGTLARQPLALWDGDEQLTPSPWMYTTRSDQSPYQRMLWTIDDLIFGGTSLWTVDRDTPDGPVTNALRVPPEWWEITPDLEVLVNGVPAVDGSVILFEGPQDGLLQIAASDIRASSAMTTAWASRVKSPVPLVELHQTTDEPLEADEIRGLLDEWEAARAAGNATGYTPHNLDVRVHGETSSDLYINGRNASRLDMANFLQVPANLLEGSTSTASLTYSTQEGARNELIDYSLSYWAAPIEARLSLDDVVPAGQRVAFDLTWFTGTATPSTAPASED